MIELGGRMWVTPAEGATELGVKPANVRDWRRRDLIGDDDVVTLSSGRTMYSLDALYDAELVTRRGRTRPRLTTA